VGWSLGSSGASATDSDTLGYDLYLNGDQSECMVIERYRDSEAAIEHAANLGHLFPAVLATVSGVHGELLGEPSAELRAKFGWQRSAGSLHSLIAQSSRTSRRRHELESRFARPIGQIANPR
jgi:hypothetical protein